MKRLLAAEPTLTVGLIQAVLICGVAFGLNLTSEQVGAIVTLSTAALALLLRQAVASPAAVTQVAQNTAQALSSSAAGTVGVVTRTGANVVDAVVGGVGGLVGKLAPSAKEVEPGEAGE